MDNSILNGFHACNCALPALTGSTKCCEHCVNRSWDLPTDHSQIFTTDHLNIKPYINYQESMMYVLPQNILDLIELIGDMYNITIYRVKELEGKKYLVVGLKIKEAGDELKDAVANINFLIN